MVTAVKRDYVCAEYKSSYRSNNNFIGSNYLTVNYDNNHTENPKDWIFSSDVAQAFPNVAFAVHYSCHYLKPKDSKPARPKFYVLLVIDSVADAEQYSGLKKFINVIFLYFNTKVLDADCFFYGTTAHKIEIFDRPMSLTTYLNDVEFDAEMDDGSYGGTVIPVGSLNAIMSHVRRENPQALQQYR